MNHSATLHDSQTHSAPRSTTEIQDTTMQIVKKYNAQFLADNEYLKKNINNQSIRDILKLFCTNQEDHLVVNMGLIRYITHLDVQLIIQYIEKNVNEICARGYTSVNMNISLKNLSVTQIDKNYTFIRQTADFFATNYPTLLNHCYIHHSSTLITYVLKLMSSVFNQDTMSRMVCYST